MLSGKIKKDGKELYALFPETIEERKKGMNDFNTEAMVFLFCCPSYAVFKGCDDKRIDIAFLSRKDDSFIIKKAIKPLLPGEIVAADGIEAVIETRENLLDELNLGAGSSLDLYLNYNGNSINVISFYKDLKVKATETLEQIYNQIKLAGLDLDSAVKLGAQLGFPEDAFKNFLLSKGGL